MNIFKYQPKTIVARLKKFFQSESVIEKLLVFLKKYLGNQTIGMHNIIEHMEQMLVKIKFYE
jgi:hypothetical protein